MSSKTSSESSSPRISSSLPNLTDSTELVLHDTASKRSSGPSFKSDPSGLTPLPPRASEDYFQSTFLSFTSFVSEQTVRAKVLQAKLDNSIRLYLKFEYDCQSSIDLRNSIAQQTTILQDIHTDTLNRDESAHSRLKLHDVRDYQTRQYPSPTTLTIDAFDQVRDNELVSCSSVINPNFAQARARYKKRRRDELAFVEKLW